MVFTIKEIFLGSKELFADLWIGMESGYDWPQHPVIHLDLAEMDRSSAELLFKSLDWRISEIATSFGIDVSAAPTPGLKLSFLVSALSPRGKVVILIDEYDAPIVGALPNTEPVEKNKEILRNIRK